MTDFFAVEHVHVMLNHIPVIGTAFAALTLAFAILRKDRSTLFLGFFMCILCSIAIFFTVQSGDAAHDKFHHGSLQALMDDATHDAAEAHEESADISSVIVYIAGGLSLIGLIVMKVRPSKEFILAAIVLFVCLVSLPFLGITANLGGKIRHSEFR